MTPSDEFTPQEQDERSQRLFQYLRRFYPLRSEREAALERVRQRLFATSGQEQATQTGSPPPQHPTLHRQQERSSSMNERTMPSPRTWPRLLETVAATVVVALLVGVLIMVLNATRQSHTGAPGGMPALSPFGGTGLTLRMVNATNGWALTTKAVLRTTDGGMQWSNVTPRGGAILPGSAAAFLTATNAWIAVPSPTRATASPAGLGAPQIFRTNDGGQSWQSSALPLDLGNLQIAQITFVTPQHGWILLNQGGNGGVEQAAIARTTDGGKTWAVVSRILPASTDIPPPGKLPYGGTKTGISFLDASTGWVTGSDNVASPSWFFVTHDGGNTWHQQSLALPSGVLMAPLTILPPTFFGAADGILPARIGDTTTAFYLTHDGGQIWKPTTPLAAALVSAAFVTTLDGWVTDGTSLYITHDGGQHWTKLAASTNFTQVTQLDFVSGSLGWAISNQDHGSSSLLKTTDGGQTWMLATIATS